MIELLYEFFEAKEVQEISVVPQDILNMLNRMFKYSYSTLNDVRKILKEHWKLEPESNTLSYIRYEMDYYGSFCQTNSKGRFFTISKVFILQKYDDLMN